MTRESTTFTIRTSPEIKEGIENILTEIMEDQGIRSKGQAFGLLTDVFRDHKAKQLRPEFKDQLNTIKNLLDTTYSTVLSITELSTAALEEKELAYQKTIQTLEERIKELEFKNTALENGNNRYKKEIGEMQNKLEEAEAELKEKKQLDSILSRLERLENK